MRHVQKDKESCQALLPPEQNCTTPLRAGKYSGQIEMQVPKIPEHLSDYVEGYFKMNVKIKTQGGSTFSCMDGNLSINIPNSSFFQYSENRTISSKINSIIRDLEY